VLQGVYQSHNLFTNKTVILYIYIFVKISLSRYFMKEKNLVKYRPFDKTTCMYFVACFCNVWRIRSLVEHARYRLTCLIRIDTLYQIAIKNSLLGIHYMFSSYCCYMYIITWGNFVPKLKRLLNGHLDSQ
jgi:hypothetical protein